MTGRAFRPLSAMETARSCALRAVGCGHHTSACCLAVSTSAGVWSRRGDSAAPVRRLRCRRGLVTAASSAEMAITATIPLARIAQNGVHDEMTLVRMMSVGISLALFPARPLPGLLTGAARQFHCLPVPATEAGPEGRSARSLSRQKLRTCDRPQRAGRPGPVSGGCRLCYRHAPITCGQPPRRSPRLWRRRTPPRQHAGPGRAGFGGLTCDGQGLCSGAGAAGPGFESGPVPGDSLQDVARLELQHASVQFAAADHGDDRELPGRVNGDAV